MHEAIVTCTAVHINNTHIHSSYIQCPRVDSQCSTLTHDHAIASDSLVSMYTFFLKVLYSPHTHTHTHTSQFQGLFESVCSPHTHTHIYNIHAWQNGKWQMVLRTATNVVALQDTHTHTYRNTCIHKHTHMLHN